MLDLFFERRCAALHVREPPAHFAHLTGRTAAVRCSVGHWHRALRCAARDCAAEPNSGTPVPRRLRPSRSPRLAQSSPLQPPLPRVRPRPSCARRAADRCRTRLRLVEWHWSAPPSALLVEPADGRLQHVGLASQQLLLARRRCGRRFDSRGCAHSDQRTSRVVAAARLASALLSAALSRSTCSRSNGSASESECSTAYSD